MTMSAPEGHRHASAPERFPRTLGSAGRHLALMAACIACFFHGGAVPLTAQTEIDVEKFANRSDRIPISISGFSGKVADALKFDLEIQGFVAGPSGDAVFELVGKNDGRVEGVLKDRASGRPLLSKTYTGGTLRTQAHALADEVVETVTGRRGISRTKIAFKIESGGDSEIGVADYDGHNFVQVTRDRSITREPAWFPGTRTLYYTSYRGGNPDVYSHDLTSGERRVIANFSGLNTGAAVSPNGNALALILSKAGSPDVYVGRPDGSGLQRLTTTRELEATPTWSPDNQTLCFVSRVGGNSALYLLPSTGGSLTRLRTAGVFNATEPDWSPDGKWIAFTTQRGGGVFEICIVPAEGGSITTLVEGENPSWAPNSRNLVYMRRINRRRVLSVLDVPTKHVKDVAQITGNCSEPCWAR